MTTVKPERWQQIDELFRSALEREPEVRSAFLDQACAEDDPLRIEVKALIASHDQSESFMEAPAVEDGITRIALLEREPLQWFSNLAISPDGRWILYT